MPQRDRLDELGAAAVLAEHPLAVGQTGVGEPQCPAQCGQHVGRCPSRQPVRGLCWVALGAVLRGDALDRGDTSTTLDRSGAGR
jgi:hypothetical protein